MLSVHDLQFGYGRAPVLAGVTLEVAAGQLCGLFGPNGCGKTTLIKCCLGLLDYRQGSIRVDGHDVRSVVPERLASLVAYVPQEHRPPFPYLVKDIVMMGRTPHLAAFGRASARDRAIVADTLTGIGIATLAQLPYHELSGGQRQLVLIARAVAQQTPVILLDEPTSGLDFANQLRVWRLLRALASRGTSVLACSHDPNHVAWFCDHVVALHRDGTASEGPPERMMREALLDVLYGASCSVHQVAGTSVVLPSEVVKKP